MRGQVKYMQESFKLKGYSRNTTVSRDSNADVGRTLSSGSVSSRASTRPGETSLVRRSASAGSGGEIEAERVFVGKLPANCTAAMLRSSFSRWLHVDFAHLAPRDLASKFKIQITFRFGRLRLEPHIHTGKDNRPPCAFIEFCEAASAAAAVESGGVLVEGTKVSVSPCLKK